MLVRLVNIETRNHPLLWLATLAAPFYMTLVNLPYVALTLGYTEILEFLLAGILYGASWTKWLLTNFSKSQICCAGHWHRT